MAIKILLKRSADDRLRLVGSQVVRECSGDSRFPPQVPQEALLGDTFRNPRHHLIVQPCDATGCRAGRGRSIPLLRLAKPVLDTPPRTSDYPGRRGRSVVTREWLFTVQLVSIGPNWDN